MSQTVSLIRSADLADVAEYAYAATAPAGARLIGQQDAPSTLLGVTVLGYPDQLVEIEAVAAVID